MARPISYHRISADGPPARTLAYAVIQQSTIAVNGGFLLMGVVMAVIIAATPPSAAASRRWPLSQSNSAPSAAGAVSPSARAARLIAWRIIKGGAGRGTEWVEGFCKD